MIKTIIILVQAITIISIAPLLSGLIRKMKNNLRMRKGAGIFQPYYNISKLFVKEEVVSKDVSWIFTVTPFIVLGSSAAAMLLIPVFASGVSLNYMGDFLAVIFILALGRFFLSLAALDAGSAFGGMGSSREMFISSLVEPVAMLSIFAVSLKAGSTGLGNISSFGAVSLSSVLAGISLFIVTITETSRLPVDNQETHLELTMIHEAMVLEYSGRSLAMIELASHIKQAIFFTILANIVMPWGMPRSLDYSAVISGMLIYASKLIALAFAVSVIEVSVAKMRLFRVVDFLSLALVLAIIAVITSGMGL